jgi:DivIVA domain-containing protein
MATDKHQPSANEVTAPEPPAPAGDFEDLRDHVPADIRNVSFPVSVRGYDRDAVEAYVKRVNRVIAELEVSRSPQAAVRHALDRVGKQTVAVLQEARESADKLMEAAREQGEAEKARAKEEAAKLVVNASDDADRTKAEADKVLADAKTEASQILATAQTEAARQKQEAEQEVAARREQAEARMREIQTDTQAVWKERNALLKETHAMADKLQQLARSAAGRVAPDEPAAAESEQETAVVEPQPRERAAKPAARS